MIITALHNYTLNLIVVEDNRISGDVFRLLKENGAGSVSIIGLDSVTPDDISYMKRALSIPSPNNLARVFDFLLFREGEDERIKALMFYYLQTEEILTDESKIDDICKKNRNRCTTISMRRNDDRMIVHTAQGVIHMKIKARNSLFAWVDETKEKNKPRVDVERMGQ